MIYCLAKYLQKTNDKRFAKEHKEQIHKAVEYVLSNYYSDKKLFFTPNSIHEFPPTEEGLEIWANAVCCGALKELSKVSFIPKTTMMK